jgi:hypothetical protein
MLTYAFDLLYLIYEEEGYALGDIPGLILRHNLHGLEICPRAAQLAELALVFKAREKSRRFFQPEHLVRPNIILLRDVIISPEEIQSWISATGVKFNQIELDQIHQFRENTSSFGSLIQPVLSPSALTDLLVKVGDFNPYGDGLIEATRKNLRTLLSQAEALTQRYHVVVANPPYMGGRQINLKIKSFAESVFPEAASDTFAMFIVRSWSLLLTKGFHAMVTMESWMFLPSYNLLRRNLFTQRHLRSLVHMPYLGKGGTSMGISFGTVAAVLSNNQATLDDHSVCQCIRYYELNNEKKPITFPVKNERFSSICQLKFLEIPDAPLAYWIGEGLLNAFESSVLFEDYFFTKQGFATGNNDLLLRCWSEVEFRRICFDVKSCVETKRKTEKWYPYSKGGPYRKWYGNNDLVVDWFRDGEYMRNATDSSDKRIATLKNLEFQFREAVTWSLTSSREEGIAARLRPSGFMFDTNGMSAFAKSSLSNAAATSLLCSKVSVETMKLLNPTLAFQSGDVARIPVCNGLPATAEKIALQCVAIARADWDNFETSWDF